MRTPLRTTNTLAVGASATRPSRSRRTTSSKPAAIAARFASIGPRYDAATLACGGRTSGPALRMWVATITRAAAGRLAGVVPGGTASSGAMVAMATLGCAPLRGTTSASSVGTKADHRTRPEDMRLARTVSRVAASRASASQPRRRPTSAADRMKRSMWSRGRNSRGPRLLGRSAPTSKTRAPRWMAWDRTLACADRQGTSVPSSQTSA